MEAEDTEMANWVTTISKHEAIIEAARADGNKEALRILVLKLCIVLHKGEILGLDWRGVDMIDRRSHIKKTFTEAEGVHDLNLPKQSIRNMLVARSKKAMREQGK
jgi:hypothetical protein